MPDSPLVQIDDITVTIVATGFQGKKETFLREKGRAAVREQPTDRLVIHDGSLGFQEHRYLPDGIGE